MATTQASPQTDSRFCYGANCTWFGPIQDVGSTGKYKVKAKEEHFPPMKDASLPCCPCCGGMLLELPEENTFWTAIHAFEDGDYKAPGGGAGAKHPGYQKMFEWQRNEKTCFPTAEALAAAFKASTGTEVSTNP